MVVVVDVEVVPNTSFDVDSEMLPVTIGLPSRVAYEFVVVVTVVFPKMSVPVVTVAMILGGSDITHLF